MKSFKKEYFFAALDRETVGYISVGIDEKYNIEKNVKNGDFMKKSGFKWSRNINFGKNHYALIHQMLKH